MFRFPALLSLLLCPALAGAAPLDLASAIERALQRNEIPAIAEERIEQARARRRIAVSRLLPNVVATGALTVREEVTRDVGGGERVLVQAPESFTGGISATARLLDPAAIPLITAENRDLRAQRFDSAELRRQLAYDVAQSFVAVLAAEAVQEAAEHRVRAAQQAVDAARLRLSSGLANRNDLTRTELALSDARLSLTNAREAVQLARISLGYLMDGPVEDELIEPLVEIPVDEGEEQARQRRYDLRGLTLRADAADARAVEPWLRLLPTLDLSGAWRATDQPGFTGNNSDWNLVLALTWEIYDGGRRYADADLFGSQARELRLQAKTLERSVTREVREARTRIEAATAAADEAAIRARIAAQNEEEIDERFRAGLASALEQADAIASRFLAEAESANETLQLELERLFLRAALGLWPLAREENHEP